MATFLERRRREPGWEVKEKILGQTGKSADKLLVELKQAGYLHNKRFVQLYRSALKKQGKPIFTGGLPVEEIAGRIEAKFGRPRAEKFLELGNFHPLARLYVLFPNLNATKISKIAGQHPATVIRQLSKFKKIYPTQMDLFGRETFDRVISQSGKTSKQIQTELNSLGFKKSISSIESTRFALKGKGVPIFAGGDPIQAIAKRIEKQFGKKLAVKFMANGADHPILRAFSILPRQSLASLSRITGFSENTISKYKSKFLSSK
ncbi:hypothetical protein HY989_06700 [Candidatus Micrarchaeota archaeon]|nr:hypothetical protein [Candidatus Micrarchaeota archaeon]